MREFLDEMGVDYTYTVNDDPRASLWAEERERYGFDSRETWSLDSSMRFLLYERLCLFVKNAESVVDLTASKIEWDGKTYSQREMINMILDDLRTVFADEYEEIVSDDFKKNIWLKWAEIENYMWW